MAKQEHLKTAPFVTLWFLGDLGSARANALEMLRRGDCVGGADPSAGSAGALVVADSMADLPASYKAARSKSDPAAQFCKRFGEFCARDPGSCRAASLGGYRPDRLCAM